MAVELQKWLPHLNPHIEGGEITQVMALPEVALPTTLHYVYTKLATLYLKLKSKVHWSDIVQIHFALDS